MHNSETTWPLLSLVLRYDKLKNACLKNTVADNWLIFEKNATQEGKNF